MIDIVSAPYYNNAQLAIKFSSVPHKMFIAGRGTGKTTIHADDFLEDIIRMPRGKFGFGGLTYFHVRTKSMPAIIDQWERRGIYRNIHYFIGHKAPRKWLWDEPYHPPLDYSNCIHFWNGATIEFISFDRPEMARSGSYDALKFDEATRLKKSALDADVLPALRGNNDRFEHVRRHLGTLFTGTMPLTADGEWVFEYEKMMQEDPSRYLYLEASSTVNRKILGEQYFKDNKRRLPKIIYDVEIDNQRFNFNFKKFYISLNESVIYYDTYDYSYYDNINHDVSKEGSINSLGDKDCLKDSPLYLSFDFGSTQNCCVVAQRRISSNSFPTIKNFYVENESLTILVKQFTDYYKYHKNKTIYLYGGSDGTRKNDAISRDSYFSEVEKWLIAAKWNVIHRYQNHEISHMDKFLFFSKYLAGDYSFLPRFTINGNNAMECYASMKNAPIKDQEIRKDKSSERNTNIPRWKATDLSDAWDNLYYWELYPMARDIDSGPSFDMMIR
ncbi:MAG: hypothetical protein M0Q51_06510 [Bacteroidales bacterium]|nr:hypothetical protein [Bacteroidales bacterium]